MPFGGLGLGYVILCAIAGGCKESSTTTTTTSPIYIGDERTTEPTAVLDDDDLHRARFPLQPGDLGTAENPIVLGGSSEDSEEPIIMPTGCNNNCTTTTTTPRPPDAPGAAQHPYSLCSVDPEDAVAMREHLGWGPYRLNQEEQPRTDPVVTAFNRRMHGIRRRRCCEDNDGGDRRFCPVLYLERYLDPSLHAQHHADFHLPSPTLMPPVHRLPHAELLVHRVRRSEVEKKSE